MKTTSRRGLAMMNMLIFSVMFTVLAGVLLIFLSSHARFLESSVRRIKGYYLAEAGSVAALDAVRRGVAPVSVNVEWRYDAAGTPVVNKTVTVTNQVGVGISGTMVLNARGNYTYTW